MEWETQRVGVKFTTGTRERVLAEIRALKGDDWRPYNAAARYLLDAGIEPALAMQLVDRSIKLKETWNNVWTKAQLLHAAGKELRGAGRRAAGPDAGQGARRTSSRPTTWPRPWSAGRSSPRPGPAGVALAQLRLAELARRGARDRLGEDDRLGDPELRELRTEPLLELGRGRRPALREEPLWPAAARPSGGGPRRPPPPPSPQGGPSARSPDPPRRSTPRRT